MIIPVVRAKWGQVDMPSHCLLASMVSDVELAVNLIEETLYMIVFLLLILIFSVFGLQRFDYDMCISL